MSSWQKSDRLCTSHKLWKIASCVGLIICLCLVWHSDHLKWQKYHIVSSWQYTGPNTRQAIRVFIPPDLHLIGIWDKTGTYGSHYVRRKTLLNTAHILTWQKTKHYIPLNQLDLPAKVKHWLQTPPTPPSALESTCLLLSESPPCCLYLGEIASQRALSVVPCGFSETSKACGRQRTCTTDNSKRSYRFCWSLKWRWMRAQYPGLSFITRITLRFHRTAFVMRDSFELSWPELLRTFKCLVDQQFHIRQDVQVKCTQSKNY